MFWKRVWNSQKKSPFLWIGKFIEFPFPRECDVITLELAWVSEAVFKATSVIRWQDSTESYTHITTPCTSSTAFYVTAISYSFFGFLYSSFLSHPIKNHLCIKSCPSGTSWRMNFPFFSFERKYIFEVSLVFRCRSPDSTQTFCTDHVLRLPFFAFPLEFVLSLLFWESTQEVPAPLQISTIAETYALLSFRIPSNLQTFSLSQTHAANDFCSS